jgi:hypothetical protein
LLVAEAGADSHALAADGAAAAQYCCPGLGLHARAETVNFHASAAIGLKCALGHEDTLLFLNEILRLDGKDQVYRRLRQEASAKSAQAQIRIPKPPGSTALEMLKCHHPRGSDELSPHTLVTIYPSFTINGATPSFQPKVV